MIFVWLACAVLTAFAAATRGRGARAPCGTGCRWDLPTLRQACGSRLCDLSALRLEPGADAASSVRCTRVAS